MPTYERIPTVEKVAAGLPWKWILGLAAVIILFGPMNLLASIKSPTAYAILIAILGYLVIRKVL